MSNWYDNAEVIVNGSGIMAESLSVSSRNSVEGVKALGFKGQVQYVARGPLQTNVAIDYFLEPANEPNFSQIGSLKSNLTSYNYPPMRIEICGITGSGWIERYTAKTTTNTPTKATVNYVIYDELSGRNSLQVTGIFDQSQLLRTAHGWSTFLIPNTATDTIFSEFEYNCSIDWKPIFGLGKKSPIQMQLGGINENLSITRNIFKPITYSGQPSYEYYDGFTGIVLSGLEASWGVGTSGITFNISGVPVINSDMSINTNNYITVKSSINKYY